MALLLTLAALLGRFAGKILGTALDWAGTLLFGRVPESRRFLLTLISLASLGWLVAVVGILLPDVGTYLLVAIPPPVAADRTIIRLAMLVIALGVPALVGGASMFLQDPADRPRGMSIVRRVLRGYPFAFGLSVTLVVVAAIAVVRRARSLSRRWSESHIPIAIRPGCYEQVARDLEVAFDAAGLEMERRDAPRALEAPARFLAIIAGPGAVPLIPPRLVQLTGAGLEVLVYPFDIACSGRRPELARARAAIGGRLGSVAAYQTVSPAAHEVEDRLRAIGRPPGPSAARPAAGDREAALRRTRHQVAAIETELASLDVPYDDWETLQRIAMQIERSAR
jgi:hypothetical protein